MKRSDRHTARYKLTLVAAVVAGVGLVATVNAMTSQEAPSGSQDLNRIFERTLPLAPGGILRISNNSGPITVQSRKGDEVSVTITRHVAVRRTAGWLTAGWGVDRAIGDVDRKAIAALQPEFRVQPDAIDIQTLQTPAQQDALVTYHYDVKLPPGRRLAVATADGPVTILGVEGDVSAGSDNGNVRCEAITGNLSARARNGAIEVRQLDGALRARATNGAIRVDSHMLIRAYPLHCVSENGPIEVDLPFDAAFHIRAATVNGHVASDFSVAGTPNNLPRAALEGPVGEGGPEVDLQTLNGSVYVNAS